MIDIVNEKIKVLLSGNFPEKIEPAVSSNESERKLADTVNKLIEHSIEIQNYILPLSKGKLREAQIGPKNYLGSPFREFHSRLTHLTWQVGQIAKGDYSQQIDFMGDFSESFNFMIDALDKNEKALKESEKKFRTLFEISPYSIFISDLNGYIVNCNQQFVKMQATKYGTEEQKGRKISEFFSGEEFTHMYANIKKTIEEGTLQSAEYSMLREDGTSFPVEAASSLITDDNGRPAAILVYAKDITERKKAIKLIKESENLNSSLLHNSPNPVIGINPDTSIKYVNFAFERLTGYSFSELDGRKAPFPWWPEGKHEIIMEDLILAFQEGATSLEKCFVSKNGEKFWVEINSVPVNTYENRFYYLSNWTDITIRKKAEEEKKLLEKQLFESQKMESIGRLAGGVAHDFNNILLIVLGYADILRHKYSDITKIEGKAADRIYRNSIRASALVSQLLGFSRRGKYNPEPLSINKVIRDSVNVSEKIFEMKIDVTYNFEKDIQLCEADKNQMDQVLTNLIINAKDAMPYGGKLVFKTENVCLEKEAVNSIPHLKPGKYVKSSVADTGVGIPEEIKDKIFEPFFTTKGVGEGTGLGLATVYGILRNHQGHIEVNSKTGIGTTFTFYLPVTGSDAVDLNEVTAITKGDKTILVVDDEKDLREILLEQLESFGYKVLLACNGMDAVTIFEKRRNEIDLVLLDMIMPEMDGKETYFALRKIKPDVKALLFSGYSQDERTTEILNDGAVGFVQKPIEPIMLSRVISEALKK